MRKIAIASAAAVVMAAVSAAQVSPKAVRSATEMEPLLASLATTNTARAASRQRSSRNSCRTRSLRPRC